jgi:hypothetical protein
MEFDARNEAYTSYKKLVDEDYSKVSNSQKTKHEVFKMQQQKSKT